MTKQIVFNGRCVVGTVALNDDTGMWVARCPPLHSGVLAPLLNAEPDCGQHSTKGAAVEAVLRATGVHSIWDM